MWQWGHLETSGRRRQQLPPKEREQERDATWRRARPILKHGTVDAGSFLTRQSARPTLSPQKVCLSLHPLVEFCRIIAQDIRVGDICAAHYFFQDHKVLQRSGKGGHPSGSLSCGGIRRPGVHDCDKLWPIWLRLMLWLMRAFMRGVRSLAHSEAVLQ